MGNVLAAKIAHSLDERIEDLPCAKKELSVDEVYYRQAHISPQFGAGGSFVSLLEHLLQGKISLGHSWRRAGLRFFWF